MGAENTAANSARLHGSARSPVAGARRMGAAPPDERVLISVILRRSGPGRIGADPDEMNSVVDFLRSGGMEVTAVDADRRTVTVEGPVAVAQRLFGVALDVYEAGTRRYRGREGHVHLPAELHDVVQAVLGLDNRAQAKPHLRIGPELTSPSARPLTDANDETEVAPLWPAQVAAAYEFPQGTGAGETIALLQFGGGYSDEELAEYFRQTGVTAPRVEWVGVDGATNDPTGSGADEEVLLDIQICGAVAPGAAIVVYFADATDRGFVDALTSAIHDRTHTPSVISISWGAAEDDWTPQARAAVADALEDAALLGITAFAAAGDHGAGDGVPDGDPHANFPASASGLVACGGTALELRDGRRHSEVVWNDDDGWAGGGGFSRAFDRPDFQAHLPHHAGDQPTGRGIPDICGNAAIRTGFITRIHGVWRPSGGTSAVAPLYAGLAAILNEKLRARVGPWNPLLYAVPHEEVELVFHDVRTGHNGTPARLGAPATAGYRARPGWDPCTGLGAIRGQGLLDHLRSRAESSAYPASSTSATSPRITSEGAS